VLGARRQTMGELTIPKAVIAMLGSSEDGRDWLASLPELVDRARARWDLSVGPAYEGGCVAFVAPAERGTGEEVVVKIGFVDEETRTEPDALALWGGQGAVRLLDVDEGSGAMLLERLKPGTRLELHPDRDEAISIACLLLRRLWRPVPADHPFRTVADLAAGLAREIPREFTREGAPFERSLVDAAVRACQEFAEGDGRPVLANRDFHLGNVLAAAREPWLLIDPKPLVGEPAFDTGHLVRSLLPEELDAGSVDRVVRRLAAELELPAERVRLWAMVRSVDDALWGMSTGGNDVAWDLDCARLLFTEA
jgi:streptomycin 6-kinase